jgi:glycosyltransferase involved in cell wall biosynthesis
VAVKLALDVSAVPPRLAGAGRYISELARRVPATGVETTLVTRRDDTLRWHDWSPSTHIASIVPNARPTRLLYEAWMAGRSATARSVDVWHSPHYTMPHRSSTPTVVTIHDLTFFTNPEWHERSKVPFFRRAISYAATHADVLVTISEFTARQLDEQVPAHAPVVVATLGVDLERFSADSSGDAQVLRAHGLSAERPYIFFLGTLEPRKGIDVLLDAFDEIAGHDSDVELWLAGQPGWGVKEIEAKISAHAALSRIRRLGFVDEAVLPALLRQARAVTYPSRGEGFGLPVLEALACGATVVTSADTVMSEIAGDAALLTRAGDAEQLAEMLTTALAMNDDEHVLRARRSRARAEIFTWDSSIAQHVKAYEMAARR